MADSTPAPSTDDPDQTVQVTDHTVTAGLADREQALQYVKLLTVIIDRVGPFQVTEREYDDADTNRFTGWSTMSVFGPNVLDSPMTFGFWDEHCTFDGLATREQQLTAVLEQHVGAEPLVQARAVLAALGLPVTPED